MSLRVYGRRLWPVLLLSAFLATLAIGLGLSWLGTDLGRAWLAQTIHERSQGALQVEGLEGHPLTAWSASALRFEDGGMTVEVKSVAVDWSAWELLTGRLHLHGMSVGEVMVKLPTAGVARESVQRDRGGWPLGVIEVDHFALTQAEVQKGGEVIARLSRIRANRALLGRNLRGEIAFDFDKWQVQAAVSGRLRDWRCDVEALSMVDADRLKLTASGNGDKAGTIKFEGSHSAAELALTGDWSRAAGVVKGHGDIQVRHDSVLHSGRWSLQGDSSLGTANVRIEGGSTAAILTRPLTWILSANRSGDGLFQGEIMESVGPDEEVEAAEAKLRIKWQKQDAGAWSAQGWLDRWSVPVTGAEGYLTGEMTAEYQAGSWQLDAAVREGEMAGLVAALEMRARGEGKNWQLQRGHLRMLGLTVTASGASEADRLQLAGEVESSDVGKLSAVAGIKGSGKLQGKFSLQGYLQGSMPKPELSWNMVAANVEVDAAAVGKAEMQGRWIVGSREGRVNLAASGLRWQAQRWRSLQLQGDIGDERLSLQGDLQGDVDVAWLLRGSRQLDVWQGSLVRLDVRDQKREWVQARSLPWSVAAERLKLERGPLKLLGHQVDWAVDAGATELFSTLDVPKFALASLTPWLPSEVRRISGGARLETHLQGRWDAPALDMKLTATDLAVALTNSDPKLSPPLINLLQAQVSVREQKLSWSSAATMRPATRVTASGAQPWRFSLRPFVFEPAEEEGGRAEIDVAVGDLEPFRAWLPRLDPLAGSIKANLVVDQPLMQPRMSGKGEFELSMLGVPEFGLDMSGKGRLDWQENRGNVQLGLSSGTGNLRLAGPFSVEDGKFPEVLFSHFPLMNTPDQQLVADGHLAVKNRDGYLWLLGELTAGPLVVVLPDIQPKATTDLVWQEDEGAKARFEQLQWTRLDVKLNLVDNGQIRGRGMNMLLGGKLHLGGSIAYPLLTGDLRIVSGGIDYRNIHLDILPDSHVTFTGDVDRPLLHVRAGRRFGEVLVGVAINGHADRPVAELFSEPAMPQAEILSYLATGRPLASLGRDGLSDAMSLAGFLLGPGTMFNSVKDKVQHSLGLDSLDVETGADGSSALVAAKRIGARTTVRLEESVAATETSAAMTLEYQLFQGLSVFARKVQNLSPAVGLKLSRKWKGETHHTAEQ